MGKRKRKQRGDDSSSSDASSSDGMSTEETRSTRSSRKTRSKEAKRTKRMFKELKDEMRGFGITAKGIERMCEELKDKMSGMQKQWKKLNKQLNGSSGDVSLAPRSEQDQMELPRFRLAITDKVKDKVGKGESILTEHGDPINIVLYDGGNVIANDETLASASVMMVVLKGKFNKGDNKCSWCKEDFQKNILRPVSGGTFNLAGGSCSLRDAKILENSSNMKVRLGVIVVSQTKERVLEGLSNRFLVRDPPKKSKEVMEQFLTPLPEPAPVDGSSTPGNNTEPTTGEENFGNIMTSGIFIEPALVDGSSTPGNNTEQATGSSTPGNSTHGANLQYPVQPLQQPSSYTGGGQFPATTDNMMNPHPYGPNGWGDFAAGSEHMSMLRPVQPLSDWPAGGLHSSTISDLFSGPVYSPTGLGGLEEYIIRPVQLLWDRPDVEPSKRWNLLDQLMPLYSRQPKIHSGDFPTMRLMPEHYDSLTTYPQGPYQRLFLMKMMRNLQITTIPKEVMQTYRNRGVLIQPLEPDDSDDEPLLKRKLHNKYQLRFVNKVCEAYYTWDQIKADDGNLLNVALYDENNSKITSGPLSSASVEVVVLHGDFNANGQDYWTLEEFSSCVVCPQSGKGRSALGGDRVLVLVDGEASVGYAFFQETSSFARTGKFKMGVKMKTTIEKRIQEGISESFFVTSRRGKGLNINSRELRKKALPTLVGPDYAKKPSRALSSRSRPPPLDLEEIKSTMDTFLKDPPAVIAHPAHPVHELKLLTTGGAQFPCGGCQEPGYGPRYRCETCNFDLHMWCALAPNTLRHPLFEGSTFVSTPASPDPDVRRLCDACGDRVRGFLYHCRERDLDLHPCCAGLAMSIGPAYELCKGVSPPCNLCIDRCPGSWFYRSHMDGEAVDIHVACVKRMARGSREVGDLAHVAKMIKGQLLRSLPMKTVGSSGFERFCKDFGTVASLIIAVIFGIPTSKIAALELERYDIHARARARAAIMDVGRRAPGVPRGMH